LHTKWVLNVSYSCQGPILNSHLGENFDPRGEVVPQG
jgi:hypothetical protein